MGAVLLFNYINAIESPVYLQSITYSTNKPGWLEFVMPTVAECLTAVYPCFSSFW